MTENEPTKPVRTMDLEALKALAHPLRVQIVDTLSTYGAFTASGLAERLGESSGATSYHLRQLEKHNFVREVEGRGTARERWWERVPGAIRVGNTNEYGSEAGRAASQLVLNEWTNSRERNLRDFVDRGESELPEDWAEASTVSLANISVTVEQLAEITAGLETFIDEKLAQYRGQRIAGARPVQVQIAAFPVIDGTITTSEDAS
jgi:DNA-binding transcriptional ArsR family regulator